MLYFGNQQREKPSAHIQCRTSFDPADSLARHLESGHIEGDVLNFKHPKGALYYTSGWVMDIEATERREKQLSEHLGFVDTQKLYNASPHRDDCKSNCLQQQQQQQHHPRRSNWMQ
mmetsp:Transcript_25897/g.44056  ORF Transcript_25897/g.44056 Transcript_25897/m.44056 type:complete len:116 (-) Transcript_25897:45-392(-)